MNTTAVLETSLSAALTEADARAIYARGEEAVVFAILELAEEAGETEGGRGGPLTSDARHAFGDEAASREADAVERGKKKPGGKMGQPLLCSFLAERWAPARQIR